MRKYYFYKEETKQFLLKNGWKENPETGAWRKGNVEVRPATNSMHIEYMPIGGKIDEATDLNSICELAAHEFETPVTKTDFWIHARRFTGEWEFKTFVFDEEWAYEYLYKTMAYNELIQDEETANQIETREDVKENINPETAVAYCEHLYNYLNKNFFKWLQNKIAPYKGVRVGMTHFSIFDIVNK